MKIQLGKQYVNGNGLNVFIKSVSNISDELYCGVDLDCYMETKLYTVTGEFYSLSRCDRGLNLKHEVILTVPEEPTFECMKIRIGSVEDCVLVQQKLFEMGYGWNRNSKQPQRVDSKFLYTDEYGSIRTGMREDFFEESIKKEVFYVVLFDKVEFMDGREKITNIRDEIVETVDDLVELRERTDEILKVLYRICSRK